MKKNNYTRDSYKYFKIFISIFTILAISSLSLAQTTKGLWMVGGNLGYNNYEDGSSFNITPNGGYLITDHIGAGLLFNFSGNFSEYRNSYSSSLIPFGRYYFGSSKTQPFVMASAGYVLYQHKGKGYFSDDAYSSWDFRWNVGAGVSHFLSPYATIEGTIGYNGSVFINFGFQIFLGTGKD